MEEQQQENSVTLIGDPIKGWDAPNNYITGCLTLSLFITIYLVLTGHCHSTEFPAQPTVCLNTPGHFGTGFYPHPQMYGKGPLPVLEKIPPGLFVPEHAM